MGSYGIGPARIVAAAVEQFADEQGISWPRAIAPWDVEIVALGKPGTRRAGGRRGALRGAARRRPRVAARRPRRRAGREVRRRRAARRAAAAHGRQALARVRRRPRPRCAAARRPSRAASRWRAPRRRSGRCGADAPVGGRGRTRADLPAAVRPRPLRPAAAATLRGAPWNVWTLPNVIGLVRLALIPVFLILGLSLATTAPTRSPAIIFAVIGWSDYPDGIAARVTGQYSRFGALLDPVVDRLLVLSRRPRLLAVRAAAPLALALLVPRELVHARAGPLRAAARRRSEDQLAGPRGASGRRCRAIFLALCGWTSRRRPALLGLVLAMMPPSPTPRAGWIATRLDPQVEAEARSLVCSPAFAT